MSGARRLLRPAPAHDLLARAALSPAPIAGPAWARWSAGVDFDRIDVDAQRLLPALAARDDLPPGPPGLDERLARIARFSWLKAQGLLARALPPLAEMNAVGIPVVLIKGAAILQLDGRTAGRRPMDDLDVLVGPDHVEEAVAILGRHGFRPIVPGLDARDRAFRQQHSGLNFRDAHGAELDLHWHAIARAPHPDADRALWAGVRPATLRGVPCLVPRPEDLVVQILAHATVNGPAPPLRWLADCATIAAHAPGGALDWGHLVTELRRLRLAPAAADGFAYAREIAALEVPSGALAALRRRPRSLTEPIELALPEGRRAGRVELLVDELQGWVRLQERPGTAAGPAAWARALSAAWSLESPRALPRAVVARVGGRVVVGARRPAGTGDPRSAAVGLGVDVALTSAAPTGLLARGWWASEPHGTWSRARVALLDLVLEAPAPGPLRLTLTLNTHGPPTRVDVHLLGGPRLARWSLIGPGFVATEQAAVLPVSGGSRRARVALVVRRPIAPRRTSALPEIRPLGVAVSRLRLDPVRATSSRRR